jgi:hypothetical protein
MTSLSDRLLRHAQVLENQDMYYAEQAKKPCAAQARRATAKLLREAAKELSGRVGR